MLTLERYGRGENARYVDWDGGRLWFSYRTPVAFWTAEKGLTVRENDWGPTTGRHLAAIEREFLREGRARISGDDFEARLRSGIPADFSVPIDGPGIETQGGCR